MNDYKTETKKIQRSLDHLVTSKIKGSTQRMMWMCQKEKGDSLNNFPGDKTVTI